VILFAPGFSGPLLQISSSGGEPKPATEIDPSRPGSSHRWPQFFPDGRRFLYLNFFIGPEHQGIYAGSLDSKERFGW